MDRRRILILAVIAAVILSFFCIILPRNIAALYSSILLPVVLFLGFILALQVASNYSKDLKMSFLFLGLFLIIYTIVNIEPIWQLLLRLKLVYVVLSLQIINYAMLIASCVFTLRVIEAKKMNRYGWIVFGLLSILCVFIIIDGIPQMILGLNVSPAIGISGMMLRVFDLAIVLMLVPVLALYIQNSRAKAQESITFALIMCGIIISLFSTYIIGFAIPLDVAIEQGFLNAIYLFGYILTAIGLYSHRKWNEWGFQAIEKALGQGVLDG